MPAIRRPLARIIILFVPLVCSGSMYLYWIRVPGALHAANVRTGLPQKKPLTDLYPRWYGTREVVLHHRDPYGDEVSHEIQIAYYGRALNPSEPADRLDQERFAYPLYVVFLMIPIVPMKFDAVRLVVWWVLTAVSAGSLFCWLRFLRIHLSVVAGFAVFALALTSLPVLQGLTLLQLGLLVASLIAGAAVCTASGRLFLAGALLAVATIKPQMCILPIGWFLLWAAGDWRNRKAFVWGFGATLATLLFASELLLPGWLVHYPKTLVAYSEYTNAKSFLGGLLPSGLSWIISIVAVLGVTVFCWRVRRKPADSVWFAIALAFVMTLTVTVMPTVNALFNQVLLFPAILLGFRYWKELTDGHRIRRLIFYLICACGFLPWVLAVIVMVVRPDLHDQWYLPMWSAPLYSSFALPVVVFFFLILLCRVVTTDRPDTPQRTPLARVGTI